MADIKVNKKEGIIYLENQHEQADKGDVQQLSVQP